MRLEASTVQLQKNLFDLKTGYLHELATPNNVQPEPSIDWSRFGLLRLAYLVSILLQKIVSGRYLFHGAS